jgi:prepilin-type N-terminal cleavage/methylation domain-containing protein
MCPDSRCRPWGHRCNRTRRGFTLMEMIVAIAIAALIMVAARALFDVLGVQARLLITTSRAADAEMNGDRMLRQLVSQIEIATDDSIGVAGLPDVVRFRSQCYSARGWHEPCHVQLSIEPTDRGGSLTVSLSMGRTYTIEGRAHPKALIYLKSAAIGGDWRVAWKEPFAVPLAIGIVFPSDTLLLRVGERG